MLASGSFGSICPLKHQATSHLAENVPAGQVQMRGEWQVPEPSCMGHRWCLAM